MQPQRIKYAVWVTGIVAALVIVWYVWVSKGTPRGQPPLTSLTRNYLDQFKHDFNSAGDETRLVLLLSPT